MKQRFFSFFKKNKETNTQDFSESPQKNKHRYRLDTGKISFYFLLTFILLIVLECLARRSLIQGLAFPFQNFMAFLANYAIIVITLLPALLFKRRIAFLALISSIWLALGATQCVLASFRVTPLTAVDFTILPNVITIIDVYLKPYQIVLIIALFLVAISALIMMFIKLPKKVRALKKCLISLGISLAVAVAVFITGFQTNTLTDRFPNLLDAYHEYGFAYCFSLTIFDKGIDEPENYSKETIDKILGEIEAGDFTEKEEQTPNIIVVQLESFFNVNRLKDVTYSEAALPNFTALMEKYESGALAVPVIGAGTVNTEFEVLTGMSTSHFGPGEYPFRSILLDQTCETIAHTLKDSGYASHAMHNHQATFYSRHIVYQNLGFSSFTPIEYMISPEFNEMSWAKDTVLIPEIFDVMASTDAQDFVFAVSVQGHGKYPTDYEADSNNIHLTSESDDPERDNQFNYYLKQIQEMDAFIGNLTAQVMAHDEPTVLVLYGDHLPSLGITDDMLSTGDIYTTEYVILSNYDMQIEKPIGDLSSYDIYPTVMEIIGNQNGVINRFHQACGEKQNFLENLEMLEYDLLYGEGYAYKYEYLTNSDMTMGHKPITVDGYEIIGDTLYVKGKNFTKFSEITFDDDEQETVFINSETLAADLDDFEIIAVRQVSDKGEVLGETAPFPQKAETTK